MPWNATNKTESKFYSGASYGKIGDYEITGHIEETSDSIYEVEEHYGPILILSKVFVHSN